MKKKWQRRTEIFIHSAKIFKSNIITNKLSLGEICNMCLLTVIICDILPISEIHTLNVTIYDQCLLCQQNTRYIFMWIRWKELHSYDNNHLIIRKQYNNTASTIEKIAVQNRRDIGRQHLTNFREAENIRKKSKESAKTSASFTANPFRFTKSLLEGEKSGKPDCSMEASHLQQTQSNKQRDNPLGGCSRINPVSEPEMETSEPTWNEIKEIVGKARSRSAPGPYKVYNICLMLRRRVSTLSRVF